MDGIKRKVKRCHKDLQAACQASKGDYAGAVQGVLERERKDVVAIADFMVKLQKMIGQVSKDYQQTDSATSAKRIAKYLNFI